MATQLTFAQAFAGWDSEIKPAVIAQYGADDTVALSESWNDYTDGLCKDGQLSDLQYHHCPAWDDEIPDEDGAFLLAAMGVTFASLRIPARSGSHPDANAEWDASASHWRILVKRGRVEFEVEYSMGAAHTGVPDDESVFNSLLMDTSDIEGETFESWAENLGYDTDSRRAERAFQACQKELLNLKSMFTTAELDDLRETFADF